MSYKQYKNPKDKKITIRIDTKTNNKLRKEAVKRRISLSELISDRLQNNKTHRKLTGYQISSIIESIEDLKKIEKSVTDAGCIEQIKSVKERINKIWDC